MLDLAIIGSGPAALAAALYATRGGLKAKVFERGKIGGTLPEIAQISNYPGFDGKGAELAAAMQAQAERAGAAIAYGECTALAHYPATGDQSHFELTVDDEPVQARAVLAASGSEPIHLPFPVDAPVSYCAVCDGPLARAQRVAVIGGANSAVGEALFLANLATEVMLITHSQLKADHSLQQRLFATPNIKVRENLEPDAELLNQFDYVFVYIGKRPATSYLQELNQSNQILDDNGYILTNSRTANEIRSEDAASFQTAIPGLFAAGDVRSGAVRQVVTAAGEGATAALEVIRFLRQTD